jgi:hypothetical protein
VTPRIIRKHSQQQATVSKNNTVLPKKKMILCGSTLEPNPWMIECSNGIDDVRFLFDLFKAGDLGLQAQLWSFYT